MSEEISELDCRICGRVLPIEEFSRKKNARGFNYKCKHCHNAYAREWYKKNSVEHLKRTNNWKQNNKVKVLAYRYKVSEEEILKLLKVNQCEICGSPEDLHIDHSHETGNLRGRLCRTCNVGIGFFGDDPKNLLKAIDYLQGNTRRGL